jgi:hypothetical protein
MSCLPIITTSLRRGSHWIPRVAVLNASSHKVAAYKNDATMPLNEGLVVLGCCAIAQAVSRRLPSAGSGFDLPQAMRLLLTQLRAPDLPRAIKRCPVLNVKPTHFYSRHFSYLSAPTEHSRRTVFCARPELDTEKGKVFLFNFVDWGETESTWYVGHCVAYFTSPGR